MNGIDAYPLCWPANYQRTKYPTASKFKVSSFARVRDELFRELRLLVGYSKVILSTNIPLTKDGLPYGRHATPSDRGVAVYFTYKGKPMSIACDKWMKVEDNMQGILKTVEAMRGIQRWGASEMLDRAFSGFAALPAPASEEQPWYVVLNVNPNCSLEEAKRARNTLAMKHHPDYGDNADSTMMIKINKAWEEALQVLK